MQHYDIPPGDAGTIATLRHMKTLAQRAAIAPNVRDVAAAIVLDSGNLPMERACLLSDWISGHTQFLPDPSTAEALCPPEIAVQIIQARGVVQFDCDDVAMLTAALGMSIGLAARFVVVAFGGPFAHVWAEIGDPETDQWLTVDPPRPTVGRVPQITRQMTVEV